MATLTAPLLRFKIEFNLGNSPKDLTFTDIIDTDYNALYGITQANVKGIIRIVTPNGTILGNAGYATDDFSSPDIVGATTTWTKDINLEVDDDGLPPLGTYTFSYKFTDDDGTTVLETSKTHNYQYVSPVITIDLSMAYSTSKLTSNDSTDYTVTIGGVDYDPSITRAHKIVKPEGAACSLPAVASTNEQQRIIGGGATYTDWIHTNVWQVTLASTLAYNMELWDAVYWFVINDVASGADDITVVITDCISLYHSCMKIFTTKFEEAVGTNFARAAELEIKMVKINAFYHIWKNAERLGVEADKDTYCVKIKEVLASEVVCSESADDISEAVVPWGDGIGGTSASTFSFTVTALDPSGGNAGDVHINSATWHVWQNQAGTWVDIGSIQGSSGSAGAVVSVLENDVSDDGTAPGISLETLKTYQVPADTLDTNGDFLKITALFELALDQNMKTVSLYWASTQIGEYVSTAHISSTTKYVELVAYVHRTAAAVQFINWGAQQSGAPAMEDSMNIVAGSETLSGTVDITARGQNGVAGIADQIISKQLTVEVFNKA